MDNGDYTESNGGDGRIKKQPVVKGVVEGLSFLDVVKGKKKALSLQFDSSSQASSSSDLCSDWDVFCQAVQGVHGSVEIQKEDGVNLGDGSLNLLAKNQEADMLVNGVEGGRDLLLLENKYSVADIALINEMQPEQMDAYVQTQRQVEEVISTRHGFEEMVMDGYDRLGPIHADELVMDVVSGSCNISKAGEMLLRQVQPELNMEEVISPPCVDPPLESLHGVKELDVVGIERIGPIKR
ncbi:hypothetical protein SESBI_26031 [Sesbania bispinosa]|nr:hypothetical protein SESBI_26031 [Sesbania bispinosa]